MELLKTYLVVLDLDAPNPAQGAAIKADLQRYSSKPPLPLVMGSKRAGYLIRSALPIQEMDFDGTLRNGDSYLFLEVQGRAYSDGYMLKDAAEWIRTS